MNQQLTDQPENELPGDLVQQATESIEGEAVPPGPPPECVSTTIRTFDGLEKSLNG